MARQFIPTALLFLALTSTLSIKILAAEAPPKPYTEIVTPTPPASDASDDDYNDYQYKAEGAAPSKSPSIATTTPVGAPSSSATLTTPSSGDSAGAPSGSIAAGGATSPAGGASIAAAPGPAAAGPSAGSAPVTKFSAVAGLVAVAAMFFY